MESIAYFVLAMVVVLLSISLHEFGHAAMADKLGDPTPRLQRRLTLNPSAHLDPIGTMLIIMSAFIGFGIGWGKPVQVNPTYFPDYRKGIILVAIAGPAMNLCIASFAIGLAYVAYNSGTYVSGFVRYVFYLVFSINLGLILFNMLPIPPLDGGNVLEQLIPWERRRAFSRYKSYGMLVLLLLVFSGLLGPAFIIIRGLIGGLIAVLLGPDFSHFIMPGAAY